MKNRLKKLAALRRPIKWYWTLLALLFCFGASFLATVAIQVGSFKATLSNFLLHPILLLLNGLPILLVLGLLYAIFGNAFCAGAITWLLFPLLSLVNRIKIEARYDAFVPSDFTLLGEAATATGEYQLDLHIPLIVGIAAFALVLFAAGFFFKSARPRWFFRLGIGVLSAGAFVLSVLTLYQDQALYTRLATTTPNVYQYNIPSVFDGLGFNYCFFYNLKLYDVDRPAGYSAQEAAQWASDAKPTQEKPAVNVIFIQCEAFSDIMHDPVFAWSETDNPLRAYDLVTSSEQAISGSVVVSNYGAGTANTEFDVITGMPTTLIAEGNTSAFRVVRRNTPSLARTMGQNGYYNYFMHPGQSWFYNRSNVYDYLGFAEQHYIADFEGYGWKGSFISDQSFKQKLLEDYALAMDAGRFPLLGFTVTIQNHQAYPYTKYYDSVPLAPFSRPVSAETTETISVYAQGIRDSAEMLLELTEYFDAREEPTLLVFWGDHLPALGKNFAVYHDLGLDIGFETTLQGTVNTYKTPFVIWGNRAYCKQNDLQSQKQTLGFTDGQTISDIYLGELVYELLGMQGSDAYFDFLGTVRRELPILRPGCYALPDGTLTSQLNENQQALVDQLHKWEYYRLKDEKVN